MRFNWPLLAKSKYNSLFLHNQSGRYCWSWPMGRTRDGNGFLVFYPNWIGLCCSVPKGIKIPPTLVNIYKSMESDPHLKGFKKPNHGDLTKWAIEGVFLLNSILTVIDNSPDSHKGCGIVWFIWLFKGGISLLIMLSNISIKNVVV